MSADFDILAALEDAAPAPSSRKCKLQRWIDDIPADQPGRDTLIAVIETTDRNSEHYRPVDQVDRLIYRLGLITSVKTIGDHRGKRCRCFV